jgi:RNA polymerase sigma factor (sigma-70 family)
MDAEIVSDGSMARQDRALSAAFVRERRRLRNFIRRWVPDPADAEDVLQDVFYELVAAARLVEPVEQIGAWLFRVARNRIIDRFRKHRIHTSRFPSPVTDSYEPAETTFEDLLPAAEAGPEAAYARQVLLEELDAALDELPADQRDVFIAHELHGRSFKELAAQSGVSVNTLLSRKRYAVLYLRRRLQAIYRDFVDL